MTDVHELDPRDLPLPSKGVLFFSPLDLKKVMKSSSPQLVLYKTTHIVNVSLLLKTNADALTAGEHLVYSPCPKIHIVNSLGMFGKQEVLWNPQDKAPFSSHSLHTVHLNKSNDRRELNNQV